MGSLGLLSGRGQRIRRRRVARAAGLWFVAPGLVLSAVTVVAGVVPGVLDCFVGSAAADLDDRVVDVHLAVWHGINQPLVLSVVALGVGRRTVPARRLVDPVLRRHATEPGVVERRLPGHAARAQRTRQPVAGVVQSGSLPVYLGVILLTAAAVPGTLLVTGEWWPGLPDFVDAPLQVPIAAVILGAAVAAAAVRRRFTAALVPRASSATRWPACSSSRVHPTWRSPRWRSSR